MATPHDALFKAIFSVPEDAAGLIRPLLPSHVADSIDWHSLRVAPGSFVDDELRASHADLLFDVRVRARPAHLYLLAEHRSRADRFTALHLLRYVARIWTRWQKLHPRARHLPCVVPIVLHHGQAPWRQPRSMRELLDTAGLDTEAADALLRMQPDFAFPVDDLAGVGDDAIRRRPVSDLARLALALLRSLRHVDDAGAIALLLRWLDALARAAASSAGTERVQVVWSYVLQVTDLSLERLAPLAANAGTDAQMILMSTASKLHAQGKAEGRAEGKAEGRAEGKAELLESMLAVRFGPLPARVLERVRAASAAELDRFATNLLRATDLDGVFDA